MKKILLIAGTRPNFIKLAPLYHRIKNGDENFEPFICHTGQHFDYNMSDIFWHNLDLPRPDYQLNIQGKNVPDTIGKTIVGINEILERTMFNLIVVFGDVNATVAGAITGVQSRIPVMHVEAGLRSFDREMPEEINRIITDHISDFLMVSEASGLVNLEREGIADDKVLLVGNIMIECLLQTKKQWQSIKLDDEINDHYLQKPIVATFHRPENVDVNDNLKQVLEIIKTFSKDQPVIFPVHPRTKAKLEENNLLAGIKKNNNILITEPLGYFEFLKLISNARLVITDSGGVQEETSFLNVPCVTFRKNTERPVTIQSGTNLLMNIWEENYFLKISQHIKIQVNKTLTDIPLWDIDVSKRILQHIKTVI